jgi:hypothetical protein
LASAAKRVDTTRFVEPGLAVGGVPGVPKNGKGIDGPVVV